MKRKLVKTADGSHTIFVPELGEHYHSIYGAIQESLHIYINAGMGISRANPIGILEYGMGTGLNILLTYIHASRSGRTVFYHTIEKYPVTRTEWELLNLSKLTECNDPRIFEKIHECKWGTATQISKNFTLYKELGDFRQANPARKFDVVYFDAFAPEVQPHLWDVEIFSRIFNSLAPGGILTTYSVKGNVKRNLKSAGFFVEKLPGPPGKREFLRGMKQE